MIARGDLRRSEALAPDPDNAPLLPASGDCPTLAEFGNTWLDHGHANRQKPSTLDNKAITFRVYLSPVLGKYRLDQIGAMAILKLKAALGELAASSTNQVLLVLSSVLTSTGFLTY